MSDICCSFGSCIAVASRNNDRTVGGKAFAWRLLGRMPSLSMAVTVTQNDVWRSERRTHLYHSCIGCNVYLRFGDKKIGELQCFLIFFQWTGTKCCMLLRVRPCGSAPLADVLVTSCIMQTRFFWCKIHRRYAWMLWLSAKDSWINRRSIDT